MHTLGRHRGVRPDPVKVRDAALRAAEVMAGMGYTGEYGSVHLMRLNIQTNTLTAILHNLIAWQISQLDTEWVFHPKGGGTPDLTNSQGVGVQVKVTSDKQIKGNKVSKNEGYYIAVGYLRKDFKVFIKWILMGLLHDDDWNRPPGTQMAILKTEARIRLEQVYP